MSTLSPTPKRSRRFPLALVIAVAVVIGALLIGLGLFVAMRDDDDKTATPAPTPACTFSAKPPTKAVRINVYNATDRAGLAGSTADALEERGFKVDDVDNDPEQETVEATAVVRYVPGAEKEALWVASQVPDATAFEVSAEGRSGSAKVDLVIGDDFEELATEEQADTGYAQNAAAPACGPSASATPAG